MLYTREDACRAWLAYNMLNPELLLKIMDRYRSAEEIYDIFTDSDAALFAESFSRQVMSQLRASAQQERMHEMMVEMRDAGLRIMSYEDYSYPGLLRNINDPPPFLFFKGDPDCLRSKCIAIVGSRDASSEGIETTYKIAYDLARKGITIVSGLALGIDAAAHRGCLDAGGKTVGLCACGIDVHYPSEHDALKEEIIQKGGILLSEFPPGSRALAWHFPVRNRLMSGMCGAVVIPECKIRSGSMTTVHHALNQGREVFAYAGRQDSTWAEGAKQLLSEGANAFESAEDILGELGWRTNRPRHVLQLRQPPMFFPDEPPITEEQKFILSKLSAGEQSFDQLAAATGLSTSALSAGLTMLQLYDLVQPLPGKRYKIKKKL